MACEARPVHDRGSLGWVVWVNLAAAVAAAAVMTAVAWHLPWPSPSDSAVARASARTALALSAVVGDRRRSPHRDAASALDVGNRGLASRCRVRTRRIHIRPSHLRRPSTRVRRGCTPTTSRARESSRRPLPARPENRTIRRRVRPCRRRWLGVLPRCTNGTVAVRQSGMDLRTSRPLRSHPETHGFTQHRGRLVHLPQPRRRRLPSSAQKDRGVIRTEVDLHPHLHLERDLRPSRPRHTPTHAGSRPGSSTPGPPGKSDAGEAPLTRTYIRTKLGS